MNKILINIILIISFEGFGQENLSLQNAIASGLEKNYDILIERKNVDVSRNNNSWGEAGRYPSIDVSVSQNNSFTDNVKVAFPTATQRQTAVTSISPGISLNWNIFQGCQSQYFQKKAGDTTRRNGRQC